MAKRTLLFAAAAAALFGAALARRPAERVLERSRPSPAPVGDAPAAVEAAAGTEELPASGEEGPFRPGAEALFRNLAVLSEEGGLRNDAVRVTAEFLGLEGGTREAFERAVEEVLAGWAALQHEMGRVFASFPADLPDEELERLQRETEERFAPQKEAILSRLEAFFSDPGLRARLPEWIALIL
jgi:hypothetical protein